MNKTLYLPPGHCLFTAYHDMLKAPKSATDGFENYSVALLIDKLEIMDFPFESEFDPFYKIQIVTELYGLIIEPDNTAEIN